MAFNGPIPGDYYIINAVVDGLAANVNADVPAPLNVANMVPGLMVQQWRVMGDPNAPQTILPLANLGLEAGPAGGFVQPFPPPPNFAWGMIQNGVGHIITDPATGEAWAINIPAVGQPIVLQPPGAGPFQVWNFIPV